MKRYDSNSGRSRRREFDDGDHCRCDFRQFRSSRARGAGKNRDGHRGNQRCGGERFDFNPHQRSIENYGMDQSENGNRRRRQRYCSPPEPPP